MTILCTVSTLVPTAAPAAEVSATILIASLELVSSALTASMALVELLMDGIKIGIAVVLEVMSNRVAGMPANSMSYRSVRR